MLYCPVQIVVWEGFQNLEPNAIRLISQDIHLPNTVGSDSWAGVAMPIFLVLTCISWRPPSLETQGRQTSLV